MTNEARAHENSLQGLEATFSLLLQRQPVLFYKALEIVQDKISKDNSVKEPRLHTYNLAFTGRPNRVSLPLYLRWRGGEKKKSGSQEAKPFQNDLETSVLGVAIITAAGD